MSPLQVSQRTVTKQNLAFFIFNYFKLKRGREKGSAQGKELVLRICLMNQQGEFCNSAACESATETDSWGSLKLSSQTCEFFKQHFTTSRLAASLSQDEKRSPDFSLQKHTQLNKQCECFTCAETCFEWKVIYPKRAWWAGVDLTSFCYCKPAAICTPALKGFLSFGGLLGLWWPLSNPQGSFQSSLWQTRRNSTISPDKSYTDHKAWWPPSDLYAEKYWVILESVGCRTETHAEISSWLVRIHQPALKGKQD